MCDKIQLIDYNKLNINIGVKMQHTSFEVTYMYGTLASSQSMGRCVITSIGEMFPAITHNLHETEQHMSMTLCKSSH